MVNIIKKIFGKDEEEFKIILFEHVNNTKYFKGIIKGIIKDDIVLGLHLHLPSEKNSIRIEKNDAFLPSLKGKYLLVCKYAKDDHRIIRFLKEEEFYRKVTKLQLKLNEKDEPIQVLDKNDQPLLNDKGEEVFETHEVEELEEFKEPLGASSDTREAIRFSKDFNKRLAEIHGVKKGFWDKMMIPMVIIVCLCVTLAGLYMFNKNTNETLVKIGEAIGDDVDSLQKELKSPSFIQSMINRVDNTNKETEAPPK